MRNILLLTVFASSMVGTISASPAAANLLVNGGFETGDHAGWTQLGAYVTTEAGPLGPHSGQYFSGTMFYPHLWQSFTTIPGHTYALTFWGASAGAGTVNIWWNEMSNVVATHNLGSYDWTEVNVTGLVATGTTQQIGIRANTGYQYYDDVSLVDTTPTVPEPLTLSLLAAGAVLLRRTLATA